MFGDVVFNEQTLLARLRTAGRTERIAVIGESMKDFVLCKSNRLDSTLTFRHHIWLRLYPVTLESSADQWKTLASKMRSRQVILVQDLLSFRN